MSVRVVPLPAGSPLWESALSVLQQLRPHLDAAGLDAVLGDRHRGPSFLAAVDGDLAVGVAGWRVMSLTTCGRKLYVDDLVTDGAYRSRGVGSALLAELTRIAREQGCRRLDLDSAVTRYDAHRFYLRERFKIEAHHFGIDL